MTCYTIRFIEKPIKKKGSLTFDSDEREINDIDDENEVRQAIAESFILAVNVLNNGMRGVDLSISDYTNKCIWSGEGLIEEDKLKICKLKNEK